MMRKYGVWPNFGPEEETAVSQVLRSGRVNYWTGEQGKKFEEEFAEYANTKYAVALSNGTIALELALRALGVGYGDEVIVTPRTFIASISAIVMVGATPVFADVDPDSQNIRPDSIEEVLTERSRAIIAVHLAGWPCDMERLLSIAHENDLYVVEDCAQAHGALYKGRSVGGIGHVGAWSFCQDKIMTTGGEGGMITTNDSLLWERVWSLKDHGKSRDAIYNQNHPTGFRWLHESFGTNARMTEMQAAIGRVQLRKLSEWSEKRSRNASILEKCFLNIPAFRVTSTPETVRHAYYKYYVFVKKNLLKDGWNRDRILEAISGKGVPCFSGSCPEVYLENAFEGTEFKPTSRLPVARELGDSSLMFLVHPTLTTDDMHTKCQIVCEVMRQASI